MQRPSSPASSRRSEKAEFEGILSGARAGNLETRAAAQTAYRIRILREAAARADLPEQTPLEEAGALLEAETAHNVHLLREMYQRVHSEES
jgi:hypothetical protein